MTKPEPKQMRLAAVRLRQVAKMTRATVDKVPGAVLLLEGDDHDLTEVATWLDKVAEGQAE